MPFVDDITAFLSRHRGYFFGKALLMATVAGASTLFGGSILIPAMVIVGGGLALRAYGRFNDLHYYKQQMVDLYRNDIAEHLGIAPEQVTISDLKQAAQENEVIAQALARQQKKTFIEIGTSLLAGAVTFGLLFSFGDTGAFHSFTQKYLGQFLGNAVNFIGLSTVGGISSLVLHDALGLAIGARTGTIKAAAHDLIVAMDHDVAHGRPISREQVYGVLVAGNPSLQEAILTRFHKSYAWMNAAEKSNVLHTLGIASDLDALAQQINHGEIRPGRLAYLMDDGAAQQVRNHRNAAPSQEPEPAADLSKPQQRQFVERLGLGPQARDSSFTARVNAERAQQNTLTPMEGAAHGR
jgi:hypothetical protein